MTSNRLIKRIKSYMHEFKLEFEVKKDNLLVRTVDKSHLVFVIHLDWEWEQIKERLDNAKRSVENMNNCKECIICHEVCKLKAACSECYQPVCLKCHLLTIRANHGLMKCPFCRKVSGRELDTPEEVEHYIMLKLRMLLNGGRG